MTTLGYRNSAIGSGLLHLVTEPAAAVAKSSMWRNPPSQAHGPNHVENPRTIYTFSKVNRSKNIACAAGTPIDCRQIAFSPQTCFALTCLLMFCSFSQAAAAQQQQRRRQRNGRWQDHTCIIDRHSAAAIAANSSSLKPKGNHVDTYIHVL